MQNVNVYPILIKWKTNKQGLTPIGISVDLNNKRISLIQLKNKKIPLSEWDETRRQVKSSYPNASLLNSVIDTEVTKHKTFFLRREAFEMNVNKEVIKMYMSSTSSLENFYEFALHVIDTKLLKDGQPYNDDTKRRYRDEVKRALEFQEVLYFHQLDAKWLNNYKEWMQNTHKKKDGKALHINSIWKAFSFIRMIYNEAIKKGIILPGSNPFTQFQVGSCEVDLDKIKYLEISQIDAIESALIKEAFQMSDMTIRVGWRFLAMCVSGLRISDGMLLNDMHFNDAGDLELKPYKTRRHGNKAHIPIVNDRQRRYMQKTISLPLPITEAKNFRTTFNNHLNILAAWAKIPIHLTSHMGRHTMGSFLVDAGVEKKAAMSILGVKSEKVIETYLHLKESKLRSEADKLRNIM
jgi:integrase/recombinase XerC